MKRDCFGGMLYYVNQVFECNQSPDKIRKGQAANLIDLANQLFANRFWTIYNQIVLRVRLRK